MSSPADYKTFDEQFSAAWKFDRADNLEKFLDTQGASEESKKFELSVKPTFTLAIKDGKISMNTDFHQTEVPPFTFAFKLGEHFEFKEFGLHTKTLAVMRGKEFYEDVESLIEGGGRPHCNTMNVVNGELVMTSRVTVDGVTTEAKRYYKKL